MATQAVPPKIPIFGRPGRRSQASNAGGVVGYAYSSAQPPKSLFCIVTGDTMTLQAVYYPRCGHTAPTDIPDDNPTRESKIREKLRAQLCPNCYRKQLSEKNTEYAKIYKLPEIIGVSPKQEEWAIDVRTRLIDKMLRHKTKIFDGSRSDAEVNAEFDLIFSRIFQIESAEFFISHKDIPAAELWESFRDVPKIVENPQIPEPASREIVIRDTEPDTIVICYAANTKIDALMTSQRFVYDPLKKIWTYRIRREDPERERLINLISMLILKSGFAVRMEDAQKTAGPTGQICVMNDRLILEIPAEHVEAYAEACGLPGAVRQLTVDSVNGSALQEFIEKYHLAVSDAAAMRLREGSI